MRAIREGDLLWTPGADQRHSTNLAGYTTWLESHGYGKHATYDDLWKWSVSELAPFWESIWQFCGVHASREYRSVLTDPAMPGARWFEGGAPQLRRASLQARYQQPAGNPLSV